MEIDPTNNIGSSSPGSSDPVDIPDVKNKKTMRPLRTYQDDLADFVKKKKVSTASIVMAEQDRRLKNESITKGVKATKNFFTSLKASVFLIAAGVIILIVAVYFIHPVERISDFISGPSDVDDTLFDKKAEEVIEVGNKISTEIKTEVVQAIQNAPALREGEIFEIKIVHEIELPLGNGRNQIGLEKIDAEMFMSLLELNAPDKMKRSLGTDYLFGVIGTEKGKTPFMLFSIDSFDQVFSGMLEWEISIYRSVNDYFSTRLPINDFETGENALYLNNLRDIIIFNRDARAIVDAKDNIAFFYTFVNDDYLLLAEDTSIVSNIANKLNLQSLIR